MFFLKQVDKIEDSFDIINSGTKPLAAYMFTNNKKLREQFVTMVSAGGLVVNDTTLHVIMLPQTLETSCRNMLASCIITFMLVTCR